MNGKRTIAAARALAIGLLAGAALVGCSYVPEWADPTEWFGDDAPPPRKAAARPASSTPAQPAGTDKSFPALGATPERPQPQTSDAQRRQIQQGLVADRDNARYTEQVPIGGDAQAAPPPPSPAASSLAPAPRQAQAARSAPPSPPPPPTSRAAAPAADEPRVFAPDRPAAAATPRPSPSPATPPPVVPMLTAPAPQPAPAARVAAAPPPPPAQPVMSAPARSPAASPPPPPPPLQQAPAAVAPPSAAIAAPASVPQFNLPVAQDQQALAQAFSQGVAAQASPVVPVPAGTTFIGSAGGFQGGAPTRLAALGGGVPAGGPAAVITFPHGGAALGADDWAMVQRIAQSVRGGGVVRVVGHASQRTANMSMERHRLANFNVSFERAQAVARALRQAGVPAQRLVVEAVGDAQPVYYEFMPNGEAENRRVEVFVE